MPIQRYERESVPYVRPAYEPDTRTLAQLMAMAGQARAADAGRRGQARGQGWMTLGQIISSGIQSHQDQKLERAKLEASALRQQQEDAFKQRDQDIRAADIGARIGEREEAALLRREAAAEKARSEAYKRGGDVAEQVGYGPMSEIQMEDVLQGPAAGRARYTFGPGTADGPELAPTQSQQRSLDVEKSINAMGGQIGPNGQVVMPPRPEREPNPTEASLAALAARGDKGAEKALNILRGMRQRTGSAEPRPLTQTAEAQIIQRLSNQWGAANKPIKELDRQVELMNTGMEAVKRGDLAQGAQMVLVTFQKILDPPSVVRESEFARSAAGQSLMNRVQGAYERLVRGGAGITEPELQKFASLAKEAANAQRQAAGLDRMKSRLGMTADRYNIPRELLFDDDGVQAPPPPSRVRMQAPDGSIQEVDPSMVDHYTKLGAKVVK